MINTIGHQAIQKTTESVLERLKEGPVKSTLFDKAGNPRSKPPFAGDGYYFWDDNIEAAEWWGLTRYTDSKREFRIFKIDIVLRYDDNSLLDLIGNRQHLKFFAEFIKKARKKVDCTGWTMEKFITYWRRLNTRQAGVFPFKIIRFIDITLARSIQQPLSLTSRHHAVLLDPFFIICVFDSSDLNLTSYKFVK